jgi:hypothetical protein
MSASVRLRANEALKLSGAPSIAVGRVVSEYSLSAAARLGR